MTGKGGVGKTTVSLALGLAATAAGRRTIVCEVASQHSGAELLGKSGTGFDETELRDGLWMISIDPEASIREYLELQLPVRAMGDLLYRSRIFSYLAAATPGLKEMVTIGKIWELALKDRKTRGAEPYDLVIVDAPATGHGIGLLQTPRTFAEIARRGPMANQASTIDRTLRNHKRSGAVIVALPEEMPVNESATLEAELLELEIAVDAIYMNGLFPERFTAAEEELLGAARAGAGPGVSSAIGAALDEARRARAHREQLARLRELAQTDDRRAALRVQPRARERRPRAHRRGARRLEISRGAARGPLDLHLRRLRRRRQDDDLGGDRSRDGGPRARRSPC